MSPELPPPAAVHDILDRLAPICGPFESRERSDPVSTLVATILSQNTTDATSHRAFVTLCERFPTWDDVLAAPASDIEDAIRVCGLASQKARTIHGALAAIRDQTGGDWSLEFLRDMPVEEARGWLTAIDGVGIKTASIVLLFSLDLPAFPVDTHVHRVAGRLGLIPPRMSAAKAHHALEASVAPDVYYPLHMALVRHGRTVCRAPRPRCEACPLADLCPSSGVSLPPDADGTCVDVSDLL